MARTNLLVIILSALVFGAHAQFGFFDQMFNGGGHHQQQAQNVRSDSSWYQAQYENGPCPCLLPLSSHSHVICASTFPRSPCSPLPCLFCSSCSRHLQHNVTNTSAPVPCPASAFRTTVPAHGKPSRTKSSWERGLLSVGPREGIRVGSLRRRLRWRGRGCCEDAH